MTMAVRDSEASGRIRELYDEIKLALDLSFLPCYFEALSEAPAFLEIAWNQTKASLTAESMEREVAALRSLSGDGIKRSYFTSDHVAAISRAGLTDDLPKTRQVVSLFDDLNPRLLLLFVALRLSAEGATIAAQPTPEPKRIAREKEIAPIERVEEEAAARDEKLGPLYENIREDLNLPFVPDEFKSLAKWPIYLEYAWHKQKTFLKGSRFNELRTRLIQTTERCAVKTVGTARISPSQLKAAGLNEPQIARAHEMVCAFSGLLPTLMLAVSTLKVGLGMPIDPA